MGQRAWTFMAVENAEREFAGNLGYGDVFGQRVLAGQGIATTSGRPEPPTQDLSAGMVTATQLSVLDHGSSRTRSLRAAGGFVS